MLPTYDVNEVFRKYAQSKYPMEEACGLVVDNKFVPIENVAEAKNISFSMPTDTWGKYENIQAILQGCDCPSTEDIECQIRTLVPWGICRVHREYVSNVYYFGTHDCIPPLLGREFRPGPSGTDMKGDCYALIKDWYWKKRNVELPEFPRNPEWWNNGQNLYEENFEKAGFYEISPEEVDVGDVFMCRLVNNVISHAGVLIEDGKILHHLTKRLSLREPAHRWRPAIVKWVRYDAS